jgi:hypothetical protein
VLLVVELVSPGNATMDRRFKPMLYAEAGIPAYCRLEAGLAPMLMISEPDSGRYLKRTTALSDAVSRVDTPFPFEIDPAGLARQ